MDEESAKVWVTVAAMKVLLGLLYTTVYRHTNFTADDVLATHKKCAECWTIRPSLYRLMQHSPMYCLTRWRAKSIGFCAGLRKILQHRPRSRKRPPPVAPLDHQRGRQCVGALDAGQCACQIGGHQWGLAGQRHGSNARDSD
jgi:hypothetical protein